MPRVLLLLVSMVACLKVDGWRTSIRGPGWDGEGSLVQTKLWNELVAYCQQLQCLRLDLTAPSATHAFLQSTLQSLFTLTRLRSEPLNDAVPYMSQWTHGHN